MLDARYTKLARLLVEYSTSLRKGDVVLIDAIDIPDEFTVELMRTVRRAGATPLVEVRHGRVTRDALRGSTNTNEASDVPSDRMALYSRLLQPVLNHRVNKTRWVVLRWPTASMAQAAGMSTEGFEDFYFDVCTMNYPRMARAMVPLEKRMRRADQVHLKGPGTNLT